MEFIKKHGIKIIIILLVIFSLNRCITACNRDIKINNQTTEIAYKDSIIKIQEDSLNILSIRWKDAQTSQSAYQGIAMGNQNTLVNEIESLNNVVNSYKDQVNALKGQNDKLKKENSQLRQQLNK